MKVSLIWNPLKNDSNIDKEWRESTTIYFASIRQSNECVGGIEWTELLMLDEIKIAWKEIFAFLAWRFFLFVLARDRSRNLFFTRARVVVRGILLEGLRFFPQLIQNSCYFSRYNFLVSGVRVTLPTHARWWTPWIFLSGLRVAFLTRQHKEEIQ